MAKSKSNAGYIYVLTNPSMPGLVKVGRTGRNPDQRSAELSAPTGVPTPFVIEQVFKVKDQYSAERAAHRVLDKWRVCREEPGKRRKEFFRISPRKALAKVAKATRPFLVHKGSGGFLKVISVFTASVAVGVAIAYGVIHVAGMYGINDPTTILASALVAPPLMLVLQKTTRKRYVRYHAGQRMRTRW